jgi:hypothetical protein
MKTLLLASATVLTLGMGAAFATPSPTGFNSMSNTRVGTSGDPSGVVASNAPDTYAYMTPQGLVPRAKAPALPVARPTPLGALEAYQSDAAGGGG